MNTALIKRMLFVCFTIVAYGSQAQIEHQVSKEEYEKTKASIIVLKNESSKIPLKGKDALDIAFCHIGEFPINKLQGYFERYFHVKKWTLQLGRSPKYKDDQASLKILLIELAKEPTEDLIRSLVQEQIEQQNVITVLFGTKELFKSSKLNFSDASHLVYVEGDSDLHQSLAVQLLFGAIGTSQKLEEDINYFYKKGSGLTIEGGIRLSYSPPEIAGMDRTVLNEGIAMISKMAIDSAAFPGCQVLVVKNHQVVYHETWGYHTFDQNRKVEQNDIYDFASVTKITSALPALMKLHGEGKLKLDEPLKTYFPKFKKSNKAELSIRNILAHNAQLKPWIPYWRSTIKKNGKYRCKTFKTKKSRRYPIGITDQLYLHRNYKKKIYKAIRKSPLNEEPGYVYSGLVFYLWPEIVSNLVEQDFETYLKSTFYQPLGASTITYNPDRLFSLDRIVPTEHDTFFRNTQIHGKVHDEGAIMMGGVSANAGLFGSSNDLAKLMQMYLNGGTYGGQRFIAEASVKEFTRCQFCEEENRRGLGFDKPLIEYHPAKSSVARDASPASYGHSGYTGTFTWVDPEYELIYIFFSNRVYPTRENRKIYQLNIRPQIHQVIYDSFLKE